MTDCKRNNKLWHPRELATTSRSILHEVVGPNIVLESSGLLDTAIRARAPPWAQFPRFSESKGSAERQINPQPTHPLYAY